VVVAGAAAVEVEAVAAAGIADGAAAVEVLAAAAGGAAGLGAATCAAIVFCLLTIHN
jgi:hypothetical protein